ncbi:MAG: pilus assembly protein PilE, partial [Gammaproteobacteria bacterium]|nr:pilus assembly protein PilE [Gammaproteobacteria bacterium]
QAPQTGDAQCVQLTLASTGAQGALDSHGNNNTKTCWGSN